MKDIPYALIPALLLSILLLSCASDDGDIAEPCEPSTINVNIEFRKVSNSCSEIDLLWDISFGVSVEFEIGVECVENCEDVMIFYYKNQLLLTENDTIEFDQNVASLAFYKCNEVVFPSQTINTRIDNPGPIDYSVGDTLVWEFYDPRICNNLDLTGCYSENEAVDLPDFSFEYIIKPEDFDCE